MYACVHVCTHACVRRASMEIGNQECKDNSEDLLAWRQGHMEGSGSDRMGMSHSGHGSLKTTHLRRGIFYASHICLQHVGRLLWRELIVSS